MAFKLVSLGNSQQSQQQSQQQPQAESWGQAGLRNLASLGTSALEGAENVTGLLQYVAGTAPGYEPSQNTSAQLKQAYPEYLKPQGIIPETANRIASNLGGAAALAPLTGGLSAIPAVASGIGAQVGKQFAGEGWPEIIGGFLGNMGADFIKKGNQGLIKSARSQGEKLKHEYYNQVTPIAEKVKLPKQVIAPKLLELEKEALNQLPASDIDKFKKDFKLVFPLTKDKESTVKKIWDEKKRWNAAIRVLDTDNDNTKRIYNNVGKAIDNVLHKYGEQNPEFGIPFQKAEDLTTGLNAMSTVRDILEENTDVSKLLSKSGGIIGKLLLGSLAGSSFYTGPLTSAAIAGVAIPTSLAARNFMRGYDFFKNSTEGKKLLTKGLYEASLGDKSGLANTVGKIDKLLNKEEKKSSKFKLVRLGHS